VPGKVDTSLDIHPHHRYRAVFTKGTSPCITSQADTIFISAIIILPVCLRCPENLTKEFQNRWRDKRRGFSVYSGRGGKKRSTAFFVSARLSGDT
jgi:hypothetical protein